MIIIFISSKRDEIFMRRVLSKLISAPIHKIGAPSIVKSASICGIFNSDSLLSVKRA
jgi:hypothetical protein